MAENVSLGQSGPVSPPLMDYLKHPQGTSPSVIISSLDKSILQVSDR